MCLERHCKLTGNIKYIVPSEDYINGSGQSLSNDLRYTIAGMKRSTTGKLPDRIELAIGMKAMILFNLSTDAEIANGTRGTIRDIILDPREEALDLSTGRTVKLKYPPAMVLFEPEGGCQVSSAFVDHRQQHSTSAIFVFGP